MISWALSIRWRCERFVIPWMWAVFVAASVGVFAPICAEPAKEKPANEADEPLAFRRVFVPADRVEAWPRGGGKYLPIESQEFEELLRSANANSELEPGTVAIEEAEYSGTLQTDQRLAGHGRWKVRLRNGAPAFLRCSYNGLAILNARWVDVPSDPLRLGSWGQSDGQPGEYGLWVSRSGTVEFDWSRIAQVHDHSLEFPSDGPPALITRYELDLPEGRKPTMDGAFITESQSARQESKAELGALRLGRWSITHGPSPRGPLQMSEGGKSRAPAPEQRIAVRGKVNYQIGQRGLDVQAEWLLTEVPREQRELVVPLAPGLALISVAAQGQNLNWRIEQSDVAGVDQAVVQLPSPRGSQALNIALMLWQPLTLNRPWQLPHTWPKNALWTRAELSLSVAPEMELRGITPFECQQSDDHRLGEKPTDPDTFSFSSYSSNATCEVVINARQVDVEVRAGSSLTLTDPDVTGKLVTQWTVSRGELHELLGTIGSGWNIDTVETLPTDALAEWFIDRRGNQRNLAIRLTNGITPSRNITVVVGGRLQRVNIGERLPADVLRMVQWGNAKLTQQLLTLQATEPIDAETIGHAYRVGRESIGDDDIALLDEAADKNGVFDITHAGTEGGVQLTRKRGQFSAELRGETVCSGDELKSSWRIDIRPQGEAIDRLLVYATHPLGKARWIDETTDTPIAAESLAPGNPLRSGLTKDGEVWLLRLHQPSAKPLEIVVTAVNSLVGDADIALLAVPEATEQNGTIVLRASPTSTPEFHADGLLPLPKPREPDHITSVYSQFPVRMAFKFAPHDCFVPLTAPRLAVNGLTEVAMPPVTIQDLSIETIFNLDGRTLHQATYELSNCGATVFKPALPIDAEIRAVTVDGAPVSFRSAGGAGLEIQLSPRESKPSLSVVYEIPSNTFTASTMLPVPLAQETHPNVKGKWIVWLPEHLTADSREFEPLDQLSWKQRLFGFLAPESHRSAVGGDHELNVPVPDRAVRPVAVSSKDTAVPENLNLLESATIAIPLPVPGTIPAIPLTAIVPSGDDSGFEANPTSSRLSGWKRVEEKFIAGNVPEGLRIGRPAVVKTWALAGLIVSFLTARKLFVGWRMQVAYIFVVCYFALLLPAVYAPLATGALWGGIGSFAWRWLFTENKIPAQAVQATAIFALAIGACTRPAAAEAVPKSAPDSSSSAATATETVLIPIDAQRNLVGTKVYLSEPFFRRLLKASQHEQISDHQWFIRAAVYSGELNEVRGEPDVEAGMWTLAFEIETVRRKMVLRLPLLREEAAWHPTAMLDGVPTPIDWATDGRSCAIAVPEPGSYQLTFSCTPKVARTEGTGKIRLTVPPLPTAKVVLCSPPKLSELRLDQVALSPEPKSQPGTRIGELTHADHVGVSWPVVDSKEIVGKALVVSELHWFHFGLDETEMVSKFIVEGGTGRPETLDIRYDSQWELKRELPPVPEGRGDSPASNTEVLRIPLRGDNRERQEVVARWRLKTTARSGTSRLLPSSIISAAATQRWLAVSADPALECALVNSRASTATSKEFQNKWGNATQDAAPQIVLANIPANESLLLSLRPHEKASVIRETLHVAAGKQSLRIAYLAEVSPGPAQRFQFRVNVPANLVVDEISLDEGDAQIPVRWSRESDTQLSMLFGARVNSDYRLTIRGGIPLTLATPTGVPRISSVAPRATHQSLQVYRDDNLSVQVSGFPPTAEIKAEMSSPPPIQWLVRAVGAYVWNEATVGGAQIVVRPNQPQIAGDTLTVLANEGGKWRSDFYARFATPTDRLDSVCIFFPRECQGPYEIDSSEAVTTDFKAVEDRNAAIVRFTTPVPQGKNVELHFRSALGISGGVPVAVPDIKIESFQGRSFLAAPKDDSSHELSWSHDGVKPAVIAATKLGEHIVGNMHLLFEVVAHPFNVALHSQTVQKPAPRIQIADTTVTLDSRGGQIVYSHYVLAPDGVAQCNIHLPAGQTLIGIDLNGQAAQVSRVKDGGWQLRLDSTNLPQLVDVVSQVDSRQRRVDDRTMEQPTLLTSERAIPTDVSLWTVVRLHNSSSCRIDEASPASAIDQAALRFDRLIGIAEAARPTAVDLPNSNAAAWFAAWDVALHSARGQAMRAMRRATDVSSVSELSGTSQEQIENAIRRTERWGSAVAPLYQAAALRGPMSVKSSNRLADEEMVASSRDAVSYFVFDGEKASLTYTSRRLAELPWIQSWAGGLAAIGGGALVVWFLSVPLAREFVRRWPQAIGVIIGLAYWALLWPSWLGLVLVAVSVWLAVRNTWPGQSVRPEASTVLRSPRALPAPPGN